MHGLDRPITRQLPPKAQRLPRFSVHHGIELVDEYAWLRADNWQEVMRDPEALDAQIRAYLEAENAYTEGALADTAALQKALYAEMRARIKEDDSSVPAPDGAFEYFASYVTGGQYPRLCRQRRGGGGEEVLLDGNKEAEGMSYWQVGATAHSPDHKFLAYAVDDKGSELFTIRIRDLATGKDLPDAIPDTRSAIVWARDSQTLFYVRLDANQRPLFVYRHRVGTPAEQDRLVYEEKDIGFYVGVGQTQSGKFVTIDAHDHQTTEVYLIDADRADSAPRLAVPREHGHEYGVEHHGERLIITTNSDGAEDFRVCEAPVATPEQASWREIIPHKPGRLILEVIAYQGHLVRLEREDGLPRIVIRRFADGAEHTIAFAEEAYSLGYRRRLRVRHHDRALHLLVDDHACPGVRLRHGGAHAHLAQDAGGAERAQPRRLRHAPAAGAGRRRGERARFAALQKGHAARRLRAALPLRLRRLRHRHAGKLLDQPAKPRRSRLRLRHRPHPRRQGQGLSLVYARQAREEAQHLHRLHRRGRVPGQGGLHPARPHRCQWRLGRGMLMGVIANMAPDLFLGIIADVPFVDVLNTMLDESLPLTPPEWPEWGNPIASKADFEIIRSYSPYENVASRAYPHIFAYAGLTDPRVTYWEPAKWIARLRHLNTGQNLLLLKTNMEAGHGGASGRFEALKELALDYAFALKISGKVGA
jgi:oligopeptidase B